MCTTKASLEDFVWAKCIICARWILFARGIQFKDKCPFSSISIHFAIQLALMTHSSLHFKAIDTLVVCVSCRDLHRLIVFNSDVRACAFPPRILSFDIVI